MRTLKRARSYLEAERRALLVGKGTILVPAGKWLLQEREMLNLMLKWRSQNMEAFFARFTPSLDSLANYLIKGPIGDEARILFLVIQQNKLVGHLGLANVRDFHAELDNVLKSDLWCQDPSSATMRDCVESLLMWAKERLALEHVSLQVVSSNWRAIRLYEAVGFKCKILDSGPNAHSSTPINPRASYETEHENSERRKIIMELNLDSP